LGKSTPAPPAAPSPTATAQAQTTENVDTAAAQAALDYVNQVSPYGTTTYNQTGSYTTPDSGATVPTYTETTALSPVGQDVLTGTENIANSLVPYAATLGNQAGAAATTPLNFNTADSATLNSAPQQLDQTSANAVYNEQASFLGPQWQQAQQNLTDSLSRQGIPVGSQAYQNAMTNFNNSQTQAYQAAQDSATAQGTSDAATNFNLALAGQQQNIAQQAQAQQQPVSLLEQLLGTTTTPQQPIVQPTSVPVSPTDYTGATAISSNAAQQAYQDQIAQQNSTTGGIAGLAGTALTAAAVAY
jgi:hypothetical protein